MIEIYKKKIKVCCLLLYRCNVGFHEFLEHSTSSKKHLWGFSNEIIVTVNIFSSWLYNPILPQYFTKHEDLCMKRWNLRAGFWTLWKEKGMQTKTWDVMQHYWLSLRRAYRSDSWCYPVTIYWTGEWGCCGICKTKAKHVQCGKLLTKSGQVLWCSASYLYIWKNQVICILFCVLMTPSI